MTNTKRVRINVGNVHLVRGEGGDLAAMSLLLEEAGVLLDDVPDEFRGHL